MSTQTTLGEPQVRKKSKKTERDVIFTANGSKRASEDVWRTGALVGMESLNTRPPEKIPVEFVDWPFSKLEDYSDIGELFDAHLKVVRGERPKYAVAPDIDDRVGYDDAISWADELQPYADTVIVVPKTVLPTDVPSGFRVGMPCQERYGPTPWKWPQYRHCEEVHLLGGSPVKHHEILKYYVPVESLDTAVPVRCAQWGDYWNGKKWENSDYGFYGSLKRSYSNLRQSINPRRRVWSPRARNRHHDYETAFKDRDDTGLFDHTEDLPRPPREAYYECDSPEELAEWMVERVR